MQPSSNWSVKSRPHRSRPPKTPPPRNHRPPSRPPLPRLRRRKNSQHRDMTYQPTTSNPAPAQSSDVIRITEQDARSTHVDDLLRRNASLRGERGIARDRGRKWYLQNWFVFMIAGALAAVTAWA